VHLHVGNVWRTFVRLGRTMVNHNPSNGRCQKVTWRPHILFVIVWRTYVRLGRIMINTIGREMCDVHLVIFRAKKYKTEYRTSTNRTESGEMCDVHLVIFLAKKYKTAYRTSTNRAKYVGELPGTKPFNTTWFDAL